MGFHYKADEKQAEKDFYFCFCGKQLISDEEKRDNLCKECR